MPGWTGDLRDSWKRIIPPLLRIKQKSCEKQGAKPPLKQGWVHFIACEFSGRLPRGVFESCSWSLKKDHKESFFYSWDLVRDGFLLKAKDIGPTLSIAGIPGIDFVADDLQEFQKLDKELAQKGL
jgi:hypothetical protein